MELDSTFQMNEKIEIFSPPPKKGKWQHKSFFVLFFNAAREAQIFSNRETW
jgi:hypothetical protein